MKKYQYILTYGVTTETLTKNPAGWNNLGLTFMRHEFYHSVLRSFSLSLRFVNKTGGGYSLIKTAYDTEGIFATIGVEIKKRNPNTNDYDSLYTGVLDFTPGRFTIEDTFIECPIVDTSVLQKFISRDENEIDLLGGSTIDNGTITPLTPSEITLTGVYIVLKANKQVLICDQETMSWVNNTAYFYCELSGTQNQFELNEFGADLELQPVGLGAKTIYTNNNDYSVNVRVIYNFNFTVTIDVLTDLIEEDHWVDYKVYIKYYNTLGVTYSKLLFSERRYVDNLPHQYVYNESLSCNEAFEVEANGYIEMYAEINTALDDSNDSIQVTLCGTPTAFQMIGTVLPNPNSTAKCLFPFNAFNRALEILTNQANTLESTVMDAGGVFENDAILNGYMIRKYPTPKLNVNFRDLFKTFDAIGNLGLWYNRSTNKFIVENISSFYVNTLLFDLGEVKNFKIQPLPDGYYAKIVAGYKNEGDYEKVSGAHEFNVQREYSTVANVKEEKNIQIPYRGDSVGIEELRSLLYVDSASEDNNSDNDVFIIRTNGTTPSLDVPDDPIFYSYYNASLSPRQNAIQHGNMLTSHYKNTSPFKAQKTPKQFELEVGGVDENSDITMAELATKLIIPELYSLESYLTSTMIATLNSNPHGFVRFTSKNIRYEGFISKTEFGDFKKLATFELIAKELSEEIFNFEDDNVYEFEDDQQKAFE